MLTTWFAKSSEGCRFCSSREFELFRLFRFSLCETKGRTRKRGTVQLVRTRDTPRAKKQSCTEYSHTAIVVVVLAPGQDRGCPRHECERRGRQVLAPATSSDDPPGALQKFATFRYYHLSVAGKTSLTGAAITVFHKKTRSTMSVIVSLVWEGASGRPLGCLARACAGEVCQPRPSHLSGVVSLEPLASARAARADASLKEGR